MSTRSKRFNSLFKEKLKLSLLDDEQLDFHIKNFYFKEKLFDIINDSYSSNSNTYKQKYEFLTGILVPKEFEVHHIDIRRGNNHICNLVALPTKTHKEFHLLIRKIKALQLNKQILFDTKLYDTGGCEIIEYQFKEFLDDFIKLKQECCFWVGYRNSLLGINFGWPVENYKKLL